MKNLCRGKRQYDTLESIDYKFRKMDNAVIDGTLDMTLEQVSELKRAAIAAEMQDCVEPLEPRTAGVPTDERVGAGFSRDSVTGDVGEPECYFKSQWGETT